jgi:LPXTG-motif cell wall-anchored protein
VVEPPPVVAALEPLPKTASSLPLIGLIGMLALGAGFALSITAKRT